MTAALAGGCATADRETGLTRAEVIARYGEARNQRVSDAGERWVYQLNAGEPIIPWNVDYRPRLRIVDFDRHGRVTNMTCTQ